MWMGLTSGLEMYRSTYFKNDLLSHFSAYFPVFSNFVSFFFKKKDWFFVFFFFYQDERPDWRLFDWRKWPIRQYYECKWNVQNSSSTSKLLTITITECLEYQSFKATNFVNLQLFHQLVLSWNAKCCNVNLYIWLQPTFKLCNCALSLHLHVSLYVSY